MHLDRLLCLAASLFLLAPRGMSQNVPSFTNAQLTFEPNLGQSSSGAAYQVNHPSHRILISDDSIALVVPMDGKRTGTAGVRVLMLRWTGSHGRPQWRMDGPLRGKSNYFFGSDASHWVRNVPHSSELTEVNALPGVSIHYHASKNNELEYDVSFAPDTPVDDFRISIEGADQISVCDDGALVIKGAGLELRQPAPRAYELRDGRNASVAVSYVLHARNEVSFKVTGRHFGNELFVDPVLQYATYLGGQSTGAIADVPPSTEGLSVAVDALGNMFVMGRTNVIDFPVTRGAFLTECFNGQDGCANRPVYTVTKFNRAGQLLYSTYLSGRYGANYWDESGKLIAVDGNGFAYVVGGALQDFPTTENAYQQTCAFANDSTCAFLTKLNADGSELLYSTYFGNIFGTGSAWTLANGLALGPNGNVYVAGWTESTNLPTTGMAYQKTCPPNANSFCSSGFAARFDTNLSRTASLTFSTYLGPNGGDAEADGIAVDHYGDAYVVGLTSADLPNIAVFGSGKGPAMGRGRSPIAGETFVMKLSGSDGHALRGVTLLRGASGTAVAVDNALNVFVAGSAANGLAITPGAAQPTFGGGAMDGFVAKLDRSGFILLFSTFLGGSGDDSVNDVVLTNAGMPFVTGTTASTNFPVRPGAFKTTGPAFGSGTRDSFVAALNASGKSLYYSSYLGGSHNTVGNGITLDPAWNAYVVGTTADTDFTVTPGAFQPTLIGNTDAFLARVVIAGDLRAAVTTSSTSIGRNGVVIYHARLFNAGPDGSDNLVFTNAIPPGMSYAGVYVPNGNGCTEPAIGATTGTLTCRKTRLESGQTWYVNVYLRAVGASGTNVTNTVRVTAQTQDLWPGNNSASALVKIQ